jgi:DNA (cytosine-5)-methyltransferase 1
MQKTIRAADLFCGAGGTSKGLRRACERLSCRLDLTAINHWPTAIATHRANQPDARHICERLEHVDPRRVVPGGRLDLLVASPECTHHSVARGGRPVSDQQRASAWTVLRWAEALWIRSILIENVPEFASWGPLDSRGRPLRHRAGETYRAFLGALRSLGYHVDARVLTAADYGDPTTRRRLFILADRRRRPRWPEATHAPRPVAASQGLPAWRNARGIIDWSIPGQSIFTRQRPLAPATLRRIEAGLRKFGGRSAEPFLVILRNHSTARGLDEPAPTVTTSGAHLALCQPFLLGQQSGAAARTVDDPAPTIATGGAVSLIEPFIFANRTNNAPRRVDEPVPTLCTGNHMGLVEPFLVKFYGTAGATRLDTPLDAVTTRDRFGLVTVDGRQYRLDIRFRMLAPHELAQAQGFARDDRFCGNRTEQVRQIGNAVPVHTAQALCETTLLRTRDIAAA